MQQRDNRHNTCAILNGCLAVHQGPKIEEWRTEEISFPLANKVYEALRKRIGDVLTVLANGWSYFIG
jgi:hypothetical protein